MSAVPSPSPSSPSQGTGSPASRSPGSKATRDQVEDEAKEALADAKANLVNAEADLDRANVEYDRAMKEWKNAGRPSEGSVVDAVRSAAEARLMGLDRVNVALERVNEARHVVFEIKRQLRGPPTQRQRVSSGDDCPKDLAPDPLSSERRAELRWARAAEGSPLVQFTNDLLKAEWEVVRVEPGPTAEGTEDPAPLRVMRFRSWPLFDDTPKPEQPDDASCCMVLTADAIGCLDTAWSRRKTAITANNDGDGSFTVVKGSPGSGISRGFTYLLHLAVTGVGGVRGPVIYEARNISMAFAWLPQYDADGGFTSYAVYSTPISGMEGTPLAGLHALGDKDTVYIIDGEPQSAPSLWSYEITCAGSVYLAPPPDPYRIRYFGPQMDPSMRAEMRHNPWTADELRAAMVYMGWAGMSEETLLQRIAGVGPLPGLLGDNYSEDHLASLRFLMMMLSDEDATRVFLADDRGPSGALVSASALVHRRRNDVAPSERYSAVSFYLAPASAPVAAMLVERFGYKLLEHCTQERREQAAVMGKLFEAAALLALSAGKPMEVVKLARRRRVAAKNGAARLYRAGYAHAFQSKGEPAEGAAKLELVDGGIGVVVARWAELTPTPGEGAQPTILVPRSAQFPGVHAMTHSGFAFQVALAEGCSANAALVAAANEAGVPLHLVLLVPWFCAQAYTKAVPYAGEGVAPKQYVITLTKAELMQALRELGLAHHQRSDAAAVLVERLAPYV